MRIAKIGAGVCLVVFLLFALGCFSGLGLVRSSPDKRYITVVIPVDKPTRNNSDSDTQALQLCVYDLQTHELIPVFRADSLTISACQWSPDSQRLVFWESDSKADPLYLFDLPSRQLNRPPMEEVGPAIWSHDGSYLLVAHEATARRPLRLIWYQTSDWTKAHSVEMPTEISNVASFEWAHTLPDSPFSAIVHLGIARSENSPYYTSDKPKHDLYRVQGNTITPLTTTGDVKAFWVSPKEERLRWARVQSGRFLAVFERNLSTGAVKRVLLVESSTIPIYDGYAYRFSPDGERLAWEDEDGVAILTIPTREIHRIQAISLDESQKAHSSSQQSGWLDQPESGKMPTLGFDWQGNETLLMLRSDLEAYTFHRLQP